MGREKRAQPGPATAKERHKRAGKITKAIDRSEPLPPGLVAAKPMSAVTKSKHQSYFEFIENKDKKKPLLFEVRFTQLGHFPALVSDSTYLQP